MAARKTPTPRKGPVVKALERDLAEIRKRAPDLAASALAASALALAKELDKPGNSATSKSMCARSLLDTLERLRELVPPDEEKDKLDDISARREARRARSATAESPPRS